MNLHKFLIIAKVFQLEKNKGLKKEKVYGRLLIPQEKKLKTIPQEIKLTFLLDSKEEACLKKMNNNFKCLVVNQKVPKMETILNKELKQVKMVH